MEKKSNDDNDPTITSLNNSVQENQPIKRYDMKKYLLNYGKNKIKLTFDTRQGLVCTEDDVDILEINKDHCATITLKNNRWTFVFARQDCPIVVLDFSDWGIWVGIYTQMASVGRHCTVLQCE